MIFRIITIILPFLVFQSFANTKLLNIYNWSNYIPNSVINKFTKATGIKVNYSEYDSNEVMYAKLKTTPRIGYDIIVPSSYYIHRMYKEDLLHKINKKNVYNIKYINKLLLNRPYDYNNKYSIPFAWGATGIVINEKYFNVKNFTNWETLWKKSLKNKLLALDDMREMFSIALITLGYSVNDTNPQHIKKAYQKLKSLLPNIKVFNSNAEVNIYTDEDALLGMGWSGEINQANAENSHIRFIYPQPKFVLWIDCIAIPKYAPHIKYAEQFINFINKPEIAAEIANFNGFSTPNLAAIKLQPKNIRNNKTLYPKDDVLKKSTMELDLGSTNSLYEKYWELLKLGG